MNKLLALAVVGTALIVAAPASAQISFGVGPNGFGVNVGPHDNYGAYNYGAYDYAPRHSYASCEIVRERTVNRQGRPVYTTHRICD